MSNHHPPRDTDRRGTKMLQLATAVTAIATGLVMAATPASAQTVEMTPTAEGIPGGTMFQRVINWAGQYALWAIILGGIAGIAAWVWGALSANGGRQASGQKILGTMCVAALALGVAPTLVNLFYAAG